MIKTQIETKSAPAAIGTYSQAICCGDFVFVSGQIPLEPITGSLIEGDFSAQVRRVMENLKAIAIASSASLEQYVKLTVYLTDLQNFQVVNEVMAEFFSEPYPARAAVEVAALPKGVAIEIEGIIKKT